MCSPAYLNKIKVLQDKDIGNIKTESLSTIVMNPKPVIMPMSISMIHLNPIPKQLITSTNILGIVGYVAKN